MTFDRSIREKLIFSRELNPKFPFQEEEMSAVIPLKKEIRKLNRNAAVRAI